MRTIPALPDSLTSALRLRPDQTIAAAAGFIREQMQDLHGGHWRIQIDHEDGLVIIARRAKK